MARTSNPNSATAQFFINVKNNGFLNYPGQDGAGYAVFGKVVKGTGSRRQDQGRVATTRARQNVPVKPVVIESASLVKVSQHAPSSSPTHQRNHHGCSTHHQPRQHQARTGCRKSAEDRRELPRLRQRRPLQQHHLPSRDRRLHGPGRRFRARHEAEADQCDGRERSQERPEERALHRCHGPHLGPAFGVGAVLHQRQEQFLPGLSGPGRLGLLRVRQSHRRHRMWSTRSAR